MLLAHTIILFLGIASVHSVLPEGWKACKRSSTDYEECLKTQINNAIVSLKNGNRKMGIIPLDPLRFEAMTVEESGPVSIKMVMKNISIEGLSDTRVIAVKNDWKKMSLNLHGSLIRSRGVYIGQGQVLVLPINGTGDYSIEWINTDSTYDMTFKEITKNGKNYFQVDKMSVVLNPQKVVMNLGNLFGGNKEMGDNMNKFLNEHWREIIVNMKPAISRSLSLGYKVYINRVLSMIPAEEIDIE